MSDDGMNDTTETKTGAGSAGGETYEDAYCDGGNSPPLALGDDLSTRRSAATGGSGQSTGDNSTIIPTSNTALAGASS